MNLVTGGTGLVGIRVLFDLLKRGENVRALHRPTSDLKTVKRVFEFYDNENGSHLYSKIEWVEGDLLDLETLEKSLEGITCVYHCAAIVSFDPKDSKNMIRQNVEGTTNLVNLMLDLKIPRLAYVSSVSTLGPSRNGESVSEENYFIRNKKNSPYGISKYLAEQEVWRAAGEGLSMVMVNPSLILGASRPGISSAQIFDNVKKGMKYYPPGASAMVDVRDVSGILIELAKSEIEGERFIVFSENISFQKVMEIGSEIYNYAMPNKALHSSTLELMWRVLYLWSKISGSKPSLNKETAQRLSRVVFYNRNKLDKTINWEFIPVKESLYYFSRFYGIES